MKRLWKKIRPQGVEEKRKSIDTREAMLEGLPGILKKGDTVLVKASHGMQFEKAVEFLKDYS